MVHKNKPSQGVVHHFQSHGSNVRLEPGLKPKYYEWVADMWCGEGDGTEIRGRDCDYSLGTVHDRNSHGMLQLLFGNTPPVDVPMVYKLECDGGSIDVYRLILKFPPGTEILGYYDVEHECCPDYKLTVRYIQLKILGAEREPSKKDSFECCTDADPPKFQIPEEAQFPKDGAGYVWRPPGDDITNLVNAEYNSHGELQKIWPVPYSPAILYPIIKAKCSGDECETEQVEPDSTRDWAVSYETDKITTPAVTAICEEVHTVSPCCQCCDDESTTTTTTTTTTTSSSTSTGCCPTVPSELCIVLEFKDNGTVCCTRTTTLSRSGDIWSGTINDPCWGGDLDIDFFCQGNDVWELDLDFNGGLCVYEAIEKSCEPCFDWEYDGACSEADGCGQIGLPGQDCVAGASGEVKARVFETGGDCDPCPDDTGNCDGP